MPTQDPNNSNNLANCGLFWIANSIMSTIMGKTNRDAQRKASERNLEFQRELETLRNENMAEMEREKIAFKRQQMKVSRQYRQIESAESFNQQLARIELQAFISNYWPLDKSLPDSILTEVSNSKIAARPLPLNVILLHGALFPVTEAPLRTRTNPKEADVYKTIERELDDSVRILEDVNIYLDACTNTDIVGGNANLMNIHFIMGSLPTLVISPKYLKGKMIFNAGVWEAQAVRPLIRPLFSINYEPLIAIKEEEYLNQAIEKIKLALTIIVGAMRDSYMLLTQGKAPMINKLLDDKKRTLINTDENMKTFIRQEYANIDRALDSNRVPNLLEAYSEYDIKQMKQVAHKISESFN